MLNLDERIGEAKKTVPEIMEYDIEVVRKLYKIVFRGKAWVVKSVPFRLSLNNEWRTEFWRNTDFKCGLKRGGR